MMDLRPELGFLARFGRICLDLGHIAWIPAIWQNLGQNRHQRRQSLRMEQGGTDGRTDGTDGWVDGQILCVLQYFVPLGAAAQKRMLLIFTVF